MQRRSHSAVRRRTLPLLLGLLLLPLLGACGFQLRGLDGSSALPQSWQRMHLVSASPNSELTRIVLATFATNGVRWSERSEASHILQLGPEDFSQRNLSVNAEARAAEFDLQMRAAFRVLGSDGRTLMDDTTAMVNKQMENDPRNVVGKAEEVRILREELRGELAAQIFRRISFFAASSDAAAAEQAQDAPRG
jgi:LPS-assembly lipoprotein